LCNVSSTGSINPASINNTCSITTGNIYETGSIYMSNANPIYLKSNTDPNHYIKYDSVYDGLQLGVFTGTANNCTDNNAIILRTTKTDRNINVNTNITENCVISNQCTVQNGMTINGQINHSQYFTLKVQKSISANNNSFMYKRFDSDAYYYYSSESLQIHSSWLCAKITYAYNTTYPGNIFQGASEYVIYGSNYNSVSMVWQVGSFNYQTVITCSSSGLINIHFHQTLH